MNTNVYDIRRCGNARHALPPIHKTGKRHKGARPTLRGSSLSSQGLLVGKVEHQIGEGLAVLAQLALLSLRVVQIGPQAVLLVEVWG